MSTFADHSSRLRLRWPDWLASETLSRAGGAVRDEWIATAGDPRADGDGRARLAVAMLTLHSQRPARPLLARANARALRWVDMQIRQTRAAAALRAVEPSLPWTHRLWPQVQRLTVPLAAGFVFMVARSGLLSAFETATRVGERMAALHESRHIWPPMA